MRARRAVAMCMRCAGRTYCKKNITVFVPKKIHSFMGNIYNFRIKLFFCIEVHKLVLFKSYIWFYTLK